MARLILMMMESGLTYLITTEIPTMKSGEDGIGMMKQLQQTPEMLPHKTAHTSTMLKLRELEAVRKIFG